MELEEIPQQKEAFEKLTETKLRENQKNAVIKARNNDIIVIMNTGEGFHFNCSFFGKLQRNFEKKEFF